MDGRVKTLHPKLYAGLLAVRDNPEHVRAAAEHDIEYVDLVVRQPLSVRAHRGARWGTDEAEVIENIDIGGPTMIRAAAKNHAFGAVVVHPESYDAVLDELREADGTLSMATREALASEAFSYTARYDIAISRWFAEKGEDFPPLHVRAYEKVVDLPYGENPHQRAAFYSQVGARAHVLSQVQQHHGKQVGFNNILDLDAARARRARLRRARLRDRQAQQPVRRRRPASGALEAYRARVRVRPAERLRRRHRAQPPRRPRDGRARSPSSSSRCSSRPASTTARSRCWPRSPTCASSRTASAACRCSARRTSARSPAACSCRTAIRATPSARAWRSSPAARPPRTSGATCSSPGRSAGT